MARFLGTASGRTTTTYVDTSVNTACSQLCTYTNTCIGCVCSTVNGNINTACSTLNGNINTACSNLCTYVNTACSTLNGNINTACSNLCTFVNNCKVACNGSGAGLSGVVNSIAVAGTGISVNQSSGAVTITGTGSNGPRILFNCAGCWNGSAIIPSGDRGRFNAYEIIGSTTCWIYACSQAAYAFAGCGGCVPNFESWCCTQCSNGVVCSALGCRFGGYGCAGAIAWPFGCGQGNYQCFSACGTFGFHAYIYPSNPCDGSDRTFRYCFANTNNCCGGANNSGCALNCCGAFPACLVGVCFSTPSSGNPFGGPTNVTIIGHGRF